MANREEEFEQWRTETDYTARLQRFRALFPQEEQDTYEREAGL